MFEEYKNLQDLRKLSALQLAVLKIQIENNIKNLKKLLKKNDRPDLQIRREEKLQKYILKLNTIISLLQ
jgi:hypothetical protein